MHNVNLPKIFRPFECNTLHRLGKENDGGYLVNLQDVYDTKLLLSFGLGNDISFEKDFLKINECSLQAYDENDLEINSNFFNETKKFYKIQINEKNIEEILNENTNIFLKCDIEGSEYKILENLIKNSSKFTGVVIEFHSINQQNNFDLLTEFISKIQQKLIHTHVNNYFYYKTNNGVIPDILELTFSSSKDIFFNPNIKFPHNLDMPNNSNDLEFKISF